MLEGLPWARYPVSKTGGLRGLAGSTPSPSARGVAERLKAARCERAAGQSPSGRFESCCLRSVRSGVVETERRATVNREAQVRALPPEPSCPRGRTGDDAGPSTRKLRVRVPPGTSTRSDWRQPRGLSRPRSPGASRTAWTSFRSRSRNALALSKLPPSIACSFAWRTMSVSSPSVSDSVAASRFGTCGTTSVFRSLPRGGTAGLTPSRAGEHSDDLAPDLVSIGEIKQHACGDTFIHAEEAEQDVLGADVVVTDREGLPRAASARGTSFESGVKGDLAGRHLRLPSPGTPRERTTSTVSPSDRRTREASPSSSRSNPTRMCSVPIALCRNRASSAARITTRRARSVNRSNTQQH